MAMTGAGIAGTGLAAAGLATAMPAIASTNGTKGSNTMNTPLKGNVKHSVSRWTYGDLSIEEFNPKIKSADLEKELSEFDITLSAKADYSYSQTRDTSSFFSCRKVFLCSNNEYWIILTNIYTSYIMQSVS